MKQISCYFFPKMDDFWLGNVSLNSTRVTHGSVGRNLANQSRLLVFHTIYTASNISHVDSLSDPSTITSHLIFSFGVFLLTLFY